MKDNNQSDNLRAPDRRRRAQLQDRGPLQGHGLCEEHHGPLPQAARRDHRRARILRAAGALLQRAHHLHVHARPDQNFNREFTDYFVNGRKDDIGAFDTPKTPAVPSAG
jgi:putative protease